jgi:hypothetical protein
MKVLLLVILVIVALVLGHNYVQTGKIGFNVSLTEDERELKRLGEALSEAVSAYRVAGRGTTVGGMAPDSEVETSVDTVRRVERELDELRPRLDTEEEVKRMRQLEARIAAAKAQMGIADDGGY